jgi:hypothetical protein
MQVSNMYLYNIRFHGNEITTLSSDPFPRDEYSRYKYGDSKVGRRFGYELGEKFVQEFPRILTSDKLFVTSSAYKYVPTGSLTIAQPFADYLNHMRFIQGLEAGNLVKLERTIIFPGDYAKLPAKRRDELMKMNVIHLDEVFLYGSNLLVVDDIKVTGQHQQTITRHAEELAFEAVVFLYVVNIVNVEEAMRDPQIEDRINHTVVKSLWDVLPIIQSQHFRFNARVCKFLLSEQNRADLPAFLNKMTDDFILLLYHNCIGDGYCTMEQYRTSFRLIQETLRQRKLLKSNHLWYAPRNE